MSNNKSKIASAVFAIGAVLRTSVIHAERLPQQLKDRIRIQMMRPMKLKIFLSALSLLASAGSGIAQVVHLAWDPPSKTRIPISGYLVKWGTKSGVYTQQLDVGKATTAEIKELSPGRTYYFVVGAYHIDKRRAAFTPELKYNVPR